MADAPRMRPHWVVAKDGNVFKDGKIMLTREGGTVDRRVSHDDLVHALNLWRAHQFKHRETVEHT